MRMGYFWVQNGPFIPNKKFLGRIININFIYLLTPFIVANFKKFLQWMRMHHFSTQNGPICPNEIFFKKSVNKLCSYYLCLSTSEKSKSNINLLMKY